MNESETRVSGANRQSRKTRHKVRRSFLSSLTADDGSWFSTRNRRSRRYKIVRAIVLAVLFIFCLYLGYYILGPRLIGTE